MSSSTRSMPGMWPIRRGRRNSLQPYVSSASEFVFENVALESAAYPRCHSAGPAVSHKLWFVERRPPPQIGDAGKLAGDVVLRCVVESGLGVETSGGVSSTASIPG